jgi:hypothetical protein
MSQSMASFGGVFELSRTLYALRGLPRARTALLAVSSLATCTGSIDRSVEELFEGRFSRPSSLPHSIEMRHAS